MEETRGVVVSSSERRLLSGDASSAAASAPGSPSGLLMPPPPPGRTRPSSWVSRTVRRRLRLMRRIGQRRLSRGVVLLAAFLTFWVAAAALLLVLHRSGSFATEDRIEIAALQEAARKEGPLVVHTRAPTDPPAVEEEGQEVERQDEALQRQEGRQRLIAMEGGGPGDSDGSAWKNPPLGGSVLVRHTMRPQRYEDSSARRLHGRLGLVGEEPLWRPSHPDEASLDRLAADLRPPPCKKLNFDLTRLPEVTAIIPFRDPPMALLLRAIHSVLNLTPPSVLKELILVDDGSSGREIADGFLERYVATLPEKVKILRFEYPVGTVAARLAGIEAATADLFVLLSPAVEVQPKWLEPLALRIQMDRKHVVMPMLDFLDRVALQPTGEVAGPAMSLSWDLGESRRVRREKTSESSGSAFVESPVMSHGIFAAHREWFLDMGALDRRLRDGHASDLEMSLRLWQCGGKLEYAPCSRVFVVEDDSRPGGSRDLQRVAAVWMDEYARVVALLAGWMGGGDLDLRERKALRENFQCHNFAWYLKEVWPESSLQVIPQDLPYLGTLRNEAAAACLAVANHHNQHAQMRPCSSGTRMMFMRKTGQIIPVDQLETCLQSDGTFKECGSSDSSNGWEVTEDGAVRHGQRCLSAEPETAFATMEICKTEKRGFRGGTVPTGSQHWVWEKFVLPPSVSSLEE